MFCRRIHPHQLLRQFSSKPGGGSSSSNKFEEFKRVIHKSPLPSSSSPPPLSKAPAGGAAVPYEIPASVLEQQAKDKDALSTVVMFSVLVGTGLMGYRYRHYFDRKTTSSSGSGGPSQPVVVLSKEEKRYKRLMEKQKKEKEAKWKEERAVLLKQPKVFDCEVLIDNRIGGDYLGLNHLKARYGDVLEVLKENTGPGNQYAMCRTKGKDPQVGLYPTHYLGDKVETKQQGWFSWLF
jgi:hypothetical protein